MKLILLLALILIVQKENREFNNQVIMFHRKIISFLLLIILFLQDCSSLTMMEVVYIFIFRRVVFELIANSLSRKLPKEHDLHR